MLTLFPTTVTADAARRRAPPRRARRAAHRRRGRPVRGEGAVDRCRDPARDRAPGDAVDDRPALARAPLRDGLPARGHQPPRHGPEGSAGRVAARGLRHVRGDDGPDPGQLRRATCRTSRSPRSRRRRRRRRPNACATRAPTTPPRERRRCGRPRPGSRPRTAPATSAAPWPTSQAGHPTGRSAPVRWTDAQQPVRVEKTPGPQRAVLLRQRQEVQALPRALNARPSPSAPMRDFSDDLAELRRRVDAARAYLRVDAARGRAGELEDQMSAARLLGRPGRGPHGEHGARAAHATTWRWSTVSTRW